MPNPVKRAFAIGLVTLATACTQHAKDEFVVVETDQVSQEPAQTGKY